MSRASQLGTVEYATESAWGESSSTFGARLAVRGAPDVSGLDHTKVDANRTVQYLNDGTMPIRGVMGGSFKTDIWLPGHGSTTAGAVSLEEHENILGYVFGSAAQNGTGDTATGGTATVPTTTSTSNLTAGGIFWGGTLADGRADGQPGVVSSHAANSLTSLVALPAAMNAADVIASSVMIYPWESSASAAVQAMRFRCLTANQQFAMHGCFPQSIDITGLNPNELPMASITWGVSWWEAVSATFPSATSVDAFNPAPSTGGSLFFQERGTATRQTYSCRDFTISCQLGVAPLMGPGAVNQFQSVIGAVRVPMVITASFTVDAQTASASPTWPGRWDSDSQFYHLLYNANGGATGRRVAVYMPNVCISDRKPTQAGVDGVNRERITVRAYTGLTTTSALTLSAVRIAMG